MKVQCTVIDLEDPGVNACEFASHVGCPVIALASDVLRIQAPVP